VKLVYNSSDTTKSFLRNNITKGTKNNAGIYTIPCKICDVNYIGESDDVDRRLREHKGDVSKLNQNNPIVKHIIDNSHSINFNNASFIHNSSNVHQRKLIESFLIHSTVNMNIYKSSIPMNNTLATILVNNVYILSKLLGKINTDIT